MGRAIIKISQNALSNKNNLTLLLLWVIKIISTLNKISENLVLQFPPNKMMLKTIVNKIIKY
jgi:hypothetical protein